MEINYTALGKRIRECRVRAGLKQKDLAEMVGLEPNTISHIERAATSISLPTLMKIVNALQVTPNDLLCDSTDNAEALQGELQQLFDGLSPEDIRHIAAYARFYVAEKQSTFILPTPRR